MTARLITLTTAAGTAVANTTTEGSLARKTFVANELSAGKVFEFTASCRVTSSNSTDTILNRVRFGTSATPGSNTSCAANSAVDAANDDIVTIRGRILVQSTTRAVLIVEMSDCDAEGTMAMEQYQEILTLVPGTAYNLDITGTWSVAHASNSIQCEAFAVIEIA